MVPATAVAWDAGADDPRPAPTWWVGIALARWWLEASGLDLDVVYHVAGTVAALATGLLALAAERAGTGLGIGRWRRQAVVVWSLRVAAVAMLGAYTAGIGWPLDLLACLVAVGATVAVGVGLVRAGQRAPGWTLSAGTVVALAFAFFWCRAYVPGFVALGLALAWGAVWLASSAPRA